MPVAVFRCRHQPSWRGSSLHEPMGLWDGVNLEAGTRRPHRDAALGGKPKDDRPLCFSLCPFAINGRLAFYCPSPGAAAAVPTYPPTPFESRVDGPEGVGSGEATRVRRGTARYGTSFCLAQDEVIGRLDPGLILTPHPHRRLQAFGGAKTVEPSPAINLRPDGAEDQICQMPRLVAARPGRLAIGQAVCDCSQLPPSDAGIIHRPPTTGTGARCNSLQFRHNTKSEAEGRRGPGRYAPVSFLFPRFPVVAVVCITWEREREAGMDVGASARLSPSTKHCI
ncbi:hypothetical protein EDB80DRAFT_678285 [Ilyonectria destructans]|nr:hypothetical protein EDB80DRAFT_678285 [Ilyonectria destructans]